MAIVPGLAPMYWLPVGVLLAVLLVSPKRQWPWWVAASAAAELTANALWWHSNLLVSLGYVVANILEAVAAAALMARYAPRFSMLRRPADTAFFVVICGTATPTISATIIATIDAVIGKAPFLKTWPHIWLGDASGVLVATPLALGAIDMWQLGKIRGSRAVAELVALNLLMVVIVVAAMHGSLPTIYLALPVLMWSAMRWRMFGTLPTLAILVLATTMFTADRTGPFSNAVTVGSEIIDLQVFFAVAAITGIFTAVLSHEHRSALKALQKTNEVLEARVGQRTARLASALRAGRLGVLAFDPPHRTVQLDTTAQAFFGVEKSSMKVPDFAQCIHETDRQVFLDRIDRILSGDQQGRVEIVFRVGAAPHRTIVLDLESSAVHRVEPCIAIVRDISDRVEAQRRQRLLINELSHRVKNTLSVVQAIAMQTLQGKTDRSTRDAFLSRIGAFARSHDLLARDGWEAAALDDLIRQAVEPFARERFDLEGEDREVLLPAAQALAISMGLHELCTNSAKHGALSVKDGRVRICWELMEDRDRYRIVWTESGGPMVIPPIHRGFGTVLLEQLLAQDLRGSVTLSYLREGVHCEIEGPKPAEAAEAVDLGDEAA